MPESLMCRRGLAPGFFFFWVVLMDRTNINLATPVKLLSLAPLMSFAPILGRKGFSLWAGEAGFSTLIMAVASFFPASWVYLFKDVSQSLAEFGVYSSTAGDLTWV